MEDFTDTEFNSLKTATDEIVMKVKAAESARAEVAKKGAEKEAETLEEGTAKSAHQAPPAGSSDRGMCVPCL